MFGSCADFILVQRRRDTLLLIVPLRRLWLCELFRDLNKFILTPSRVKAPNHFIPDIYSCFLY